MKKKILFAISLAFVMICLFAVSALAVEIDGIYYTLSGSGENATAAVNTENRSSCTLETVKIPATITVDNVTYKVTEIQSNAFGQVNGDVNGSIKHLVIGSNVSVVGQHAFRRVTSLETVKIENTDASTGINFYNAQFMDCKNLKSVSAANAKIAEYGDNCFWNCNALETVDYPSTLTRIGVNAFRDCWSLTSGDLSNTQITTIASWGFGSAKGITEFKFPSTLTTIGNNNFLYCPVTTYVFPHSMKNFGQDMLAHQSQIKVLVMPKVDETTTGINNFLYTTKPNVVIYAGNNVEYFKGLSGNFSAYDVQPFENYVPGTTYAKNTIFYGATTCEFCNGILGDEEFNFTGYENEFYFASQCTHCEKETVSKRYDPMFTNLGSSAAEYEDIMSVNYKVNAQSILEYEKITGEAVNYGVFAVRADKIGTNDIFDVEGNELSGVIAADITGTNFNLFSLKIAGFTEAQKDIDLAMGAYVGTTKDEVTKYTYLQISAPTNGKYYLASYNDVVKYLESKENAQ